MVQPHSKRLVTEQSIIDGPAADLILDLIPDPSGTGVPNGGTTGQVLAKNSGTNGDASWTSTAPQANRLTTARTINGVAFDGTANIVIDLSTYATKAGSVTQFSDWQDGTPPDDAVPMWNGTTYVPTDLGDAYAPVDVSGRLAEAAWQKYFLPMVIVNEGEDAPTDFPPGGLVWETVASLSMVPVAAGSASAFGASNTVAITTTVALNVGDWIGIAIMGSGEVTLPITHTFGLSAGAWSVDATNTENHQTGTVQVNIRYAKVTTLIPLGSTVTVTYSSNRAQRAAGIFKMPNLVTSAPLDQTAVNGGNSGSTLTLSVGPTAATTVANELALTIVGWNDATTPTTRPLVGTNGWTSVLSAEADSGTGSRSLQVFYKVLSTTQAVTGTWTVNASDAASGAWSAIVATFKGL